MTTATRRRGIAATAALSLMVLAGACAAGGDDSDSRSGGDMAAPAAASAADSGGEVSADDLGSVDERNAAYEGELDTSLGFSEEGGVMQEPAGGVTGAEALADAPAEEAPSDESSGDEKLISNGAVQLKSKDVGKAIFDVRNVVDKYSGEVEANATETDDDGKPLRSRLKLRVPTAQFDNVMQDLEGVAVLIASSGNTEDVTTDVLDTNIRIQVQRRSIERISLLLEQATSIRDIVNIESQLSQRQADLAVLEKEQRYLADQTAMATINVSVERVTKQKAKPKPKDKDGSGFFAGLSDGWSGLKTFGEGLATVLGALLPWLIVLGVLAIPGLPLYRRLRRRDVTAGPAPVPSP